MVRWQEPRPEDAEPQRSQPPRNTRQRLAVQRVTQHRQQLGLQADVRRASSEPGQVGFVEAVAQRVKRAGLAALAQRPGRQWHQGL